MKKTKIICTIGPASESPEILSQLIEAGMDVARLNFSHGDHKEKTRIISELRNARRSAGKPIAVLADIQGPKLRLGEIDGRREIVRGEELTLSASDTSADIPLQMDLSDMIQTGHRIFLNDGLVELLVTRVDEKVITTEAKNDGWISSHKGVNIPDTRYTRDIFTEKDKKDVLFAVEKNLEYIALSFIQEAQEVIRVKNFIREHGGRAKICVKIEKNEAVEQLSEIISAADVVMIARGDLAIEASPAQVPVLQQKIIRMCREFQKPVVVATQMLESMIENPRPTRAEASDVGHAVMSQVDAVMLSAESAAGSYPVQAVNVMRNVIESVENAPEFRRDIGVNWESIDPVFLQSNSVVAAAESVASRLRAPFLAVASATGSTALSIASFRPASTLVAVTHEEFVQRQLNLVWGLYPIVVQPTKTADEFWNAITSEILTKKYGEAGDRVVMVGGSIVGVSGATDTIKVESLSK